MGVFLSVVPLFFLMCMAQLILVEHLGMSLSLLELIMLPLFFTGVLGSGLYLALPILKSDFKENRQRHNKCTHCGYPLRGIRDTSKVCPECGHPFKPKP